MLEGLKKITAKPAAPLAKHCRRFSEHVNCLRKKHPLPPCDRKKIAYDRVKENTGRQSGG